MKTYTRFLPALLLMAMPFNRALAEDTAKEGMGKPEMQQKIHEKMQQMMKKTDTDGDGNISKAEFLAEAEARFTKMDKNADGVITPDEHEAMRKEMHEKWQGKRKKMKDDEKSGE